MYPNLNAEMARYNVTNVDLQNVLGKGERTIREKLAGRIAITLPEAVLIRDRFFRSLTLDYLFALEVKA